MLGEIASSEVDIDDESFGQTGYGAKTRRSFPTTLMTLLQQLTFSPDGSACWPPVQI